MFGALNRKSYLVKVILCTILFVYAVATCIYYSNSYYAGHKYLLSALNWSLQSQSLLSSRQNCKLPKLNLWDPTILEYIKPNKTYAANSSVEILTKLQDGILTKTFNDSKKECAYRCMFPVSDRELEYGDWSDIKSGVTPECDVVETNCFDIEQRNISTFNYMHAQIYQTKTNPKNDKQELPNVHLIVFDSVSHSALLRTMPKTLEFLKSEFGAISFPHLNKVGSNSRPNGYAFLLGKQLRNISKSPISVGHLSDYANDDESCLKPMDDDQHVFSIFKSAGYKTAYMDDWATNAFTYPNCVGFGKNETIDHTMKPFFLRLGVGISGFKSPTISKTLRAAEKMDELMYPHFEKFIAAYPNMPKFSLMWTSYLAHNDNNNLFQADDFFVDFFTKNKEKFQNSYIFLMSDHGIRFGGIRTTKIGEMEDANPALLLVLPQHLRRNETLMNTLVQNTQQPISHYDLFATFVDIARSKHNNNGKKVILHGSSILRELPQPRTCDDLRIPIEFCNCMYPKSSKTSDNAESQQIASKLIENMNNVIQTDSLLKSVCAPLTLSLNTSILMDKFDADNDYTIYFVTFNVTPGNGSYRAYAGRPKGGGVTVLSSEYTRLDMYAKTAYCASSSLYINFCYCKELTLKSEK